MKLLTILSTMIFATLAIAGPVMERENQIDNQAESQVRDSFLDIRFV